MNSRLCDLSNKIDVSKRIYTIKYKTGVDKMLNLNCIQAEIIYNSLLMSLRAYDIEIDPKHEQLQNKILERHEVTDILDQLDQFYDFISKKNDFELENEEE